MQAVSILPAGHTRLTGSGQVARGPLLLSCIVANASAAGGTVTVYNAEDAGGAVVLTLVCAAQVPAVVPFPIGVLLDRGCYATLDGNVSSVTFTYLQVGSMDDVKP